MQCDIDILGDPSCMAEIDLISAMSTLLNKLEFSNYKIRINDRKILKAMAAYSGFSEESYDLVFIILDKMDKIGLDGVAKELEENGFPKESIEKYLGLFKEITNDIEGVKYCDEKLKGFIDEDTIDNLITIISAVTSTQTGDFKIEFDPTLVRGMSYYTGPIFEIAMEEYGGSVGGGGRYDEMIGKFTGKSTPACGFSVGFERIVMLLMERGFKVPDNSNKKVYLLEKDLTKEQVCKVLKMAADERSNGVSVCVATMNKNKKFQKQQFNSQGYTEFKEFFKDSFDK